jgi:hypothetical protein
MSFARPAAAGSEIGGLVLVEGMINKLSTSYLLAPKAFLDFHILSSLVLHSISTGFPQNIDKQRAKPNVFST